MQIQALPAPVMPSSHPELVGQGIAAGLNAITQGVQAGYSRKWQMEDDDKKSQREIEKEQRAHDWELKKEDLKIAHEKDLAEFKKHLSSATVGGEASGPEGEKSSAEEAMKALQGMTPPGGSAPSGERFNRDTAPTTIDTKNVPPMGDVTPTEAKSGQASNAAPGAEAGKQAGVFSSINIPGIMESTVSVTPSIASVTDISKPENLKYYGAGPGGTPIPAQGAAPMSNVPVPQVGTPEQVKELDQMHQYLQGTAAPAPGITPSPAPAATPAPTPSATPAATPSPTPAAPIQPISAPAPQPTPPPDLNPKDDFSTPGKISEAFGKIKGADYTEYPVPKYNTFYNPQQAAQAAQAFANPDYAPKIDTKPDKNGFYHIQWVNVRAKRLQQEEKQGEQAKKHLEFAEKLGRMDEAGIKAQVDDFNSDPAMKLMNVRAQQIPSFFNVSQMALSGDPHKSRRITDLDAIDSFIAFARGTQPTESQYSEIQNWTQGYLSDLRQKIDKGAAGARLSEDDIKTMRSLMVENYNGNANLLNPDIRAVRDVYVTKHPRHMAQELPQEFHPLLTKEYMQTEVSNAQRDMKKLAAGIAWASKHNKPDLHAELSRKYEEAKAKQFEYDKELAMAEADPEMPVNWTDWTHSRRGGWMRGMHGGVPDSAVMPTTP